jgi:APA family basic amino acid/polyamine antiporter
VNETVGVGIFLTPATMMRMLGGARPAIVIWVVMGGLTTAGALCYAELSTRFPRAGGAYVFLREGFGRRCAFVYGWMALLVMDPGITAALGIGLAQYALAAAGLSARYMPAVAIVAIVLFGLFTLLGLSTGARAMRWSAAIKLLIVGVLVIAGLFRASAGAGIAMAAASDVPPIGSGALAGSVIAAFFAFGGWWDLGRMSEEVESPRRTLPWALVGGVGMVTAIYVVVTLTFMLVAPTRVGDTNEAFVQAAGASLFGPAAGRLLAVMVALTVAGSLAAVLLGAPRTYLAMARDHLLPSGVAWFDARKQSAPVGTLVQTTLACVLVLLGSFEQILGYFVPAAVFFLGLSAATLFRLERPRRNESVFRAPLHPLPLMVFLVLVAAMVALFVAGQPIQTLLGALVVGIGLIVSWWVVPPADLART